MLKNKAVLQHSFRSEAVLLNLTEVALSALEPSNLVKLAVQLNGDILKIQRQSFNLKHYKNVIVLGAGKATFAMAEALVELLGNRITAGIINVPKPQRAYLGNIKVNAATHPYPDKKTVQGAKAIYNLAKKAKARDLVICLISGGGSSMLALPLPGITLETKINLSRQLMHASANILELNTVRKHCSAIKGGRLAQAAATATVISLIISDVLGDKLDTIASGPTVPDATTSAQAIAVLDKYRIAGKSIRRIIAHKETPKYLSKNVHNYLIGNNELALKLITQRAKQKGLKPKILTACLQGEARVVAQELAAVANKIVKAKKASRSIAQRQPVLLIAGGETTVKVTGKGYGGRNQELVLAAMPHLSPKTTILSLATDGVDGFTPIPVAGAIANSKILNLSRKKKINIQTYLAANNSYRALKKLGCLLNTGPTGTNVGDIIMVLIK